MSNTQTKRKGRTSRSKKYKKMKKLVLIMLPIIIILTVVLILVLRKPQEPQQEGEVETFTKSYLEKVLEKSDLSSVRYTYNAIARAYEEDAKTVKYYVAYEGEVTAGIDFSKIVITTDDVARTVDIALPEVEIQDVNVNMGTMEFIFENQKAEDGFITKDAVALCTKDLEARAAADNTIREMAYQNSVNAATALTQPWINRQDSSYTIHIH